jgi:hypothetical protein
LERRLQLHDRARRIAVVGEPQAPPQPRTGIVAQRADGCEERIFEPGPARAELRVAFDRALRLVAASEPAKGERERIVGRSPFGEQRQRAREATDGFFVASSGGGNAPEAEQRLWLRCRDLSERLEQPPAFVELSGVEQGLGELEPRRQISG